MTQKTIQAGRGDEVQLVHQAQQGSPEAFDELFRRWNQPLLQYMYHTLGGGQEAEDMAQEAFLRAYQRLDQLGPPWDFKSWLYRIATNLAMDYLGREKRFISSDSLDEAIDMELPTGPQPVERQVERLEQQHQVWNALGTLPTLYRQALILRELNGLSYEEIHVALDCTYENARQLVHRARLRFREQYTLDLKISTAAPRCRVLGDLLSAYHDGQLAPDERRKVEEHLATCKECRATQDEMKKIGLLLLGLPAFTPSQNWAEKVLRKVHEKEAAGSNADTLIQRPPARPTQPGPAGPGQPGRRGQPPSGIGGGGLILLAIIAGGLAVIFFGLGLLGLFVWPGWALREFTSPPQATQGSNQFSHAAFEATPTPAAERPTPSPNATPAWLPLVLEQNANCRSGPGTAYEPVDAYPAGQSLEADGRNETTPRWWQVLMPNSTQHCWVSSASGQPQGDPEQLPVVRVVAPPAGSSPGAGAGAGASGGAGAPAAPSSLAITNRVCTDSNYSVTLGWQDNANNETGFRVYRNATLIATLGANAASYTDNPPGSGPYTYRVEAFNAAGASARPSVNEEAACSNAMNHMMSGAI